jgi:glucose-1-phosphate thymidylyltransferase
MREQSRKGIILAGGSGTRLAPLTNIITKQLLPVYDKPMLYYPLSLLMLAGIREVLVIGEPQSLPLLKRAIGDGSKIGMRISYDVQAAPRGVADAFIIAGEFLAGSPACLVLGDNILYGHQLTSILRAANAREASTIFGICVQNPQDYGVITLDTEGRPVSIEEKPRRPNSNIAVPGIYFFDAQAPSIAREVMPSARGEIEIVSIIAHYIEMQRLNVELLGRGFAWIDAGTHGALLEAGNFVEMIERRQAQKIGCIEEIAYNQEWISSMQLRDLAACYEKSGYGDYLLTVLDPSARLISTPVD